MRRNKILPQYIITVASHMPPKKKTIKATAKSKSGAAQAQTAAQSVRVNVRVGDTAAKKKAKPRRRAAQSKGITRVEFKQGPSFMLPESSRTAPVYAPTETRPRPAQSDGWYPQTDMYRDGSFVGGAPSRGSLLAGPPKQQPSLLTAGPQTAPIESTPAMIRAAPETPNEAPDWTDMTDMTAWLRPTLSGRQLMPATTPQKEREDYLVNEMETPKQFAPAPEAAPSFEEIASGQPIPELRALRTPAPKITPAKEVRIPKANIVDEVNSFRNTLNLSLKDVFEDDFIPNKTISQYSVKALTKARSRLQQKMQTP